MIHHAAAWIEGGETRLSGLRRPPRTTWFFGMHERKPPPRQEKAGWATLG